MHRILAASALLSVSVLALAGCSAATADPDAATDAAFTVVTSTDVYGQIAEEIGGDAISVTSLIDSPAKDPHEYELTAQDQLRVSEADLIIRNGGGYDPFIDAAIDAAGVDAPIITAAELSPEWTGGEAEGFNEHVWYDLHTVEQLAGRIAEELTAALPDDADAFQAGLDAFTAGVDGVVAELDAIAADHGGGNVFVTEPVPLYLAAAAGLENVTPSAFSEAVEEGQDVPPATMLDSLELLRPGVTDLVIVNAQTGGPETDQVTAAAEQAGIPVLSFTETLPAGDTYLTWMQDNAAAIADALG